MQWSNWSYKPVSGHVSITDSEIPDADDEKDAEQQQLAPPGHSHPAARTRTPASASIVPLAAAMTAVLFLFLFVFAPRPWLQQSERRPDQIRYYGCGNSTHDASAAGCKFDVMSYTWVHPRCFDQELMYDFLGSSEWTWYGSDDGTQPLGLNEVARGQREYVYVTWKYYTTHCTYMWKKMHRSLLTSRSLDSYVSDYRHTEQCQRVLLDREREQDSTSVMLVAKYPSCPIVSR